MLDMHMESTFMDTILGAVGNTPLLTLEEGIVAKAEFLNPSGSIKARLAKYVVERAESEGLLKPGDTIVEATSGNTGNALSMVAAAKGYKMLVVMPEGYSSERVKISRSYGAEIRHVGHFHVNEALEESKRLGAQNGFFCPQQFDNEWNVDENRDWLGQEILRQLPQHMKIDAIVQGVGTGGTLIGVGQALRTHHNPDLKIYAMEPSESRTLECCIVCDHRIEGIADGFVPGIIERHRDMIDGYIAIDSGAAIDKAREMARARGLFVGPSAGGNYLAAQKLRSENPDIKTVLTFLCDKGEKYLSHMDV